MTETPAETMDFEAFSTIARNIEAEVRRVIVGQDDVVRAVLICILAGRHALLEGVPGLGKTMLIRTMADALDLKFSRIQFTPDMQPADITGTDILEESEDGRSKVRRFQPGPVFANLVLADEINRATPKAQSALLEAMEERQVTADGTTYALPEPFFVIGTRNPSHQIGTYPLPESQLDRFLMQIELGYPGPEAERQLLAGDERRTLVEQLEPVLSVDALLRIQEQVPKVHLAEPILDYVQALLEHTRSSGAFVAGLSPRAGIALVRAAQAWALMHGHVGVHPEDVQAVFPSVAAHRLVPASSLPPDSRGEPGAAVLEAVRLP